MQEETVGTSLAMWESEIQDIELEKGERGLGFSILDYQVRKTRVIEAVMMDVKWVRGYLNITLTTGKVRILNLGEILVYKAP